jgi:hypothetical protein
MKLLEGASEWAGPRKKSCKPQKIFVEVFPSGGPLSIWRGVHVDISRKRVKPFLTLIRGATSLCCHGIRGGTLQLKISSRRGSRQQKERFCAAVSSENPVGASEVGKNCSLHFSLLFFLHLVKQVSVRKRER